MIAEAGRCARVARGSQRAVVAYESSAWMWALDGTGSERDAAMA